MNRRNLEFACGIVIVGLLAGVAGLCTSLLLRFVEHLTYHYTFGTLLAGVTGSSPVRRAVGPMIGGALAGFGWWMLRRRAEVPPLAETIATHRCIPHVPLTIDAALQVLLVGSGASLGREGAPRQFAAALGDLGVSRWSLTERDREILLACAAGAGLAAVYSVPVGGALFATAIMLKTWHPRAVGTALITSSLAVAVASPLTHEDAPLDWPDPQLSYLLTAFAVVLAPLALGVGMAFNRLMATARAHHTPKNWLLIPAIAAAGLVIGICSIWWPELPGNGKSILTVTLNSGMTLGAAIIILFLKPLLTALFLRAGAVGGMLTPALATGAATGSVVALAINTWTEHHVSVPAVSLTCAAGVLAITQRAPIWAAIFVWELARPPWWLLAPFLVAAIAAHYLSMAIERRRIPNGHTGAVTSKRP
ncbi:chloride ion channel protein [Mycolicibacterium agri]|uniref:Chloride channel protein n=1 Tax=Mycolicibacterium agri TaxID=36811 RepID=A0A2A7NBR4_MYCAG|nr:chloride channel protein [Mycolicibacterium agri]PEG41223.1 chloride ion channel protein [Mycolicibacterium agri]GFG55326.1 chloride channel protein [Mycolicibacterium agri]